MYILAIKYITQNCSISMTCERLGRCYIWPDIIHNHFLVLQMLVCMLAKQRDFLTCAEDHQVVIRGVHGVTHRGSYSG